MGALAQSLPPGVCERCGGGNSPQARFCQHCGTPLGSDDPVGWYERVEAVPSGDEGSPAPPGTGAIVSAVVCELAPASSVDADDPPWSAASGPAEVPPETLDVAREILRRHGAAVEDLAGTTDTLAAVFGPEPADGDGPTRAARAVAELRQALEGAVAVRAGVGTAEIVGEGSVAESLWRGRVVDLATGLQRRADAGEILVAEGVSRRIAGTAELEPLDTNARIDANGPTGPLRLLEVYADPATVALGWPGLAGRDEERARVRAAFDRAVADRVGVVLRIYGHPGVGKTALATACLDDLSADGSATVVSVRWGPASEPGGPATLADLIEAVAGVTASAGAERAGAEVRRVLEGSPDAERVAAQLLPAIGLSGTPDPDGTGWALRRFLEAAAEHHSLAVLLDDGDRAGPWFLELLRSAVARAREPILVLVTGSPAGWPAAWEREPVEQLRLDPLGSEAMFSLVEDLLLNPDPPPAARERLIDAAGGNPVHLEQLVATLADRGSLRWEHRRWVPAGDLEPPAGDLAGLLSARLQDLELNERAYLGLLAVAGSAIPAELVGELVPSDDESTIRDHLAALVAGRFLGSQTHGPQETFVFPHELVREVAGATVPPEVRAEVHERCVRWLEERHGDRLGRHSQAIAAHLEAEAGHGRETGASGGDPRRRAAGILTSAAELRSALGDPEGTIAVLERAAGLLDPDDPTRGEILLRTATALAASGRRAAAHRLATQAVRAGRDAGDGAVEARARLLRAVLSDGSRRHDRVESIWEAAERAEAACRDASDDAGMSAAWSARAAVHRRWGHWAAAADDAERAADHAARAGLVREESAALRSLVLAVEELSVPLDESVERCRSVLERAGGRRLVESEAAAVLAILLARRGSFEEAGSQVEAALGAVEELDPGSELARVLHRSARVEALAGRLERAEELLLQALDAAALAGDEGVRAAIGGTLAHVLLDAGRTEEALQLLEAVSSAADDDDVVTQVTWRSARARALASTARTDDARELARQAIRLAEQTDLMDLRAGALIELAEVLRAEGRPNEAVPFARRALRMLERRGAVIPAGRARSVLESLGRPVAGPPAALPAMPAPDPGVSDAVEAEEAGDPDGPSDGPPDGQPELSSNGAGDDAFEEPPPSPFADIAFPRADRAEPVEPPAPHPEPRAHKANESAWWSFGRR